LTTHLAPEGRASPNSWRALASLLFDSSELKTALSWASAIYSEAVHRYWPSVVRTLLMFIRCQFLDRDGGC
jgi:hypothetical protein